jgi:cell fate regulator YaaT (PSP1 superfamily)
MGCSSCSSGEGGLPKGCKNNGSCGAYGCNKLDVFDYLADLSLPAGTEQFDMVELRFKNSRKAFYKNDKKLPLQTGDVVAVEASPGHDIGVVVATGELVRMQMRKKSVDPNDREIKKIYRKAHQEDIEKWREARSFEFDTMHRARKLATSLKLQMKISDVEYQGDNSKATFYYTADDRVDFRQLIKDMADAFKVRIEMRQIGARQEAGRVGGIGSCGRELCCSTWLTDFRSVSTSAARYQQLSLNPQKLAGQCGKLKCCLNYELDSYLEAIKDFPDFNTRLKTKKANAFCIKTDIFLRKMWFVYEGESSDSPVVLNVEKVQEILEKNKQGIIPESLKQFEQVIVIEKTFDYENVVGQDSVNRFDVKKGGRSKNKKKRKKPQGGQNPQGNDQRRPNPRPANNPGVN